ncbi:MAG: RNA-guided pseudouridylation complex pseudouridine synthase subunit Cbf5 [Candidatus Aenigmarchaeota archaeon]|nr:RNA-guided pseudouridylation complex pseudouridine synthase subunit Cbf5 [Candidatus Aenigmarchaeota archaeon]
MPAIERPIEKHIRNGIVILDKWPGPTSHDVTTFIGKKLGLKTAHSGTLDPAVSGVLLITLENACKLISVLQRVDKEYVGVIHLHKDVDEPAMKQAISRLIGNIKQTPPRKSAVSRKPRKRKIYDIKILDNDGRNYCLYVRCEAGTYIRVLFHQIGQALGTGAHMKELRRIRSGGFPESRATTAQELIDAYCTWKNSGEETELRKIIIPLEESIRHLKKIIVKDTALDSILHGSPLYSTGVCEMDKTIRKDDIVALFSQKDELVAVGLADKPIEKKSRLVRIKRVIMETVQKAS